MTKNQAHCHFLVAQTAKELAAHLFEGMSVDNDFYAVWKTAFPDLPRGRLQQAFINEKWPMFVKQARATLAQLLTTSLDENLKEQISDALIKDRALVRGRQGKMFA